MKDKKLTQNQTDLITEFVETYGLSSDQISFDGEAEDPIFDFDALCVLREKLTNFKAVEVSEVVFDYSNNEANAVCIIITAEDRHITVSDFAALGEPMFDGSTIQSAISAKRVARARAMRTGIRAAGVNLLAAHKNYLENGDILNFKPIDTRSVKLKELKALANEVGLIVGTDDSEYRRFLAEQFDGRTSSKDLNDFEMQRFIVLLRALRRIQNSREKLAA